ncbi:hypothetical protein [Streptomyces griseoluteus]|uniref:hypothetical protein n=1 Tax=Streptomyces griseoluteus TaxID=29306 RepID=UPI0036FE07FD
MLSITPRDPSSDGTPADDATAPGRAGPQVPLLGRAGRIRKHGGTAGTVLTSDAATVRYLLDAARDPRQDRHAADRAKLKEHLLGPADPPSPERFAAAVRESCAKSDDRRTRANARPAPATPAPRTAGDGASVRRGREPDA